MHDKRTSTGSNVVNAHEHIRQERHTAYDPDQVDSRQVYPPKDILSQVFQVNTRD